MRPIFKLLSLLFVLIFSLTVVEPLHAQTVGSLFAEGGKAAEETSKNRISDIMEQAARNGVGVVVIDSNGNIVSTEPKTDDEPIDGGTENTPQKSAWMQGQDKLVKFRSELIDRVLGLPNDFNEVVYILRASSRDGTIWAYFEALYLSLALFSVGIMIQHFVFAPYIANPLIAARTKDKPQGYSEKMPWLVFRFFMGVLGIVVSMAVAYILGGLFFGPLDHPAMQFTVSLINAAYFLSRALAALWRMILSPYMAQYRIPLLDTGDAKRLHRWLIVLGTLDVCRLLFGLWIKELGLNYDVFAFMTSVLGAGVVAANILMVLVNRAALTNAIRQGKPRENTNWLIKLLSSIWAPAVIFYMIYAWIQVTYELVLGDSPKVPLIAGAYGILLSILVVYGGINFVIERCFERTRAMRELNEMQEPDLEPEEVDSEAHEAQQPPFARQSMNTYEALARRVAGILAFVAGTNAFFYIWDNNSTQMVESYTNRLLDVMVILFIGYIVYHVFRIWIDNKIAEEQGNTTAGELGDEGGASSASRLATLLPLFRNFILIVVIVTITLIALMETGVNVGPLFAGAGVVGVAVGFGSQALVRDIFSGGFFLFDDAFRKGEYLDVGGVKGTVEKISVRSFQLRHHLGALHTIPFGEIQVMTNYSRDWVIMKLPLRVTYDTDVEKVRKLIKNLGVFLLDDPVIGENFIQPLKSQGVIEMQDSAMIIRVKFMTKPGDQWLVRKRVYEEIRILFEREGIHFAHKEVTVRLADSKADELSADDKKTISAAAHAAIEEDLMGDDDMGDDR
ncbi:MAG: mechanosensitive ion channel family protein [Roseobacter sp.]